jgi:aminobenzoyl-glutamate utilization protein B
MESRSSKLLADELERHGFKVERGVAGMPTAFVATWGRGHPVIGIMGEYDALPGISQKAVPHKEPLDEGKPGHGCGHNVYGTSGMAAAVALRYAMEKQGIKGTIKFLGTPAEENYSGKVYMVRDGYFSGVDAVLSHHPSQLNTAGLASSNAINSVKFHYYGKTAHAAGSPEQGRSAIDAVELMDVGINYMREHIIEKARIHYVIEVGGNQPNVVPDYARSWYYVRAPEREQVEQIYRWVLKIAEGAAMMTETTLKVEFLGGVHNVIPNKTLSEIVISNMREIGPIKYTKAELEFAHKIEETIPRAEKIESLKKSEMPNWEKYVDVDLITDIIDPWNEGKVSPGSTDTSDVSWNAPTMEFETTAGVVGDPGHSWHTVACSGMSIGHKSLVFAAKTIAGSALDLITKPELLKKAQDELKTRLRGRVYKSPNAEIQPPLEVARKATEKAMGKV